MTGSIFDFASRTCASTTVPRELALGAGSSGMIRVSTATSSSAASAEGIGRGKRALAARSEGAKLTISIFVVASRERLAKRYCTFAAALAAATHAHARSDCFTLRSRCELVSQDRIQIRRGVQNGNLEMWLFALRPRASKLLSF